jgi:energy-coupling factor transporter ATP-binding protein EcfA2
MPFVDVNELAGDDYARIGIAGPEGSGKTLTALKIARGLVGPEGRIAVIDTENRSSRKFRAYERFLVDVLEGNYAPAKYVEKITEAEKAGVDCLIIDSLSHAWNAPGGVLDMVDAEVSRHGNQLNAWRKASPEHNRLVDKLVHCKTNLICTLRVKSEMVVETLPNGRTRVRKVGLQPIQRDGMLYEFDLVIDMDVDHQAVVSKSRCPALDKVSFGGKDLEEGLAAAVAFGQQVREWLRTGQGKTRAQMVADAIRERARAMGKYDDGLEAVIGAAGDDLAVLDQILAGL